MTKPLRLTFGIVLTLVGAPAARADFLLEAAPPATGLPVAPQAAVPLVPPPGLITESALPPPASHVLIARGFGHRVPLSFAVRQIVPASVTVIYANDIDTRETVDWRGGEAWTTVLVRTVRPARLRIKLAPGKVTILPD